jgi:hypothetical protein
MTINRPEHYDNRTTLDDLLNMTIVQMDHFIILWFSTSPGVDWY